MIKVLLAGAACLALVASAVSLEGCGAAASSVAVAVNPNGAWVGKWAATDGSESIQMLSGETFMITFTDGRAGGSGTWKPIDAHSAQLTLSGGFGSTTATLENGVLYIVDSDGSKTAFSRV